MKTFQTCFVLFVVFQCEVSARTITRFVGETHKGPCWEKRNLNSESNVMCSGNYDSFYNPEQCDVKQKCWCVNWKTGESVSIAFHERGSVNCFKIEQEGGATSETTACLQEWRDRILAKESPVPYCNPETGEYEHMQCNEADDECWCVNVTTGVEIPGTRTDRINSFASECLVNIRLTANLFEYAAGFHTYCLRQAYEWRDARHGRAPTCDQVTGKFTPRQCSTYLETQCWCADVETGQKIEGTLMNRWVGFDIDCANITTPYSTACLRQYREAQDVTVADAVPLPCDPLTGNFEARQCFYDFNTCNCVDVITGYTIAGTERKATEFDIDCAAWTPLNTTCLRMRRQFGDSLPRDTFPRCDLKTGKFTPRQCTRGSSVCWCVDIESGVLLPGSEMDQVRGYEVDCANYAA